MVYLSESLTNLKLLFFATVGIFFSFMVRFIVL